MHARTHRKSGMSGLIIALAAIAVFLLVPAAQALAAPSVKVVVTGPGSGEVTSPTGSPAMACSYNGTSSSGTCENVPDEFNTGSETYKEALVANPASGSEFGGWRVLKGPEFNEIEYGCTNGSCEGFIENCPEAENSSIIGPNPLLECVVNSLSPGEANEFEVQATFCEEGKAIEESVYNGYWEENEMQLVGCSVGPPSYKLNLSTSGSGSGSFECEVEGTTAACEEDYEEGTEVKVLPAAGTGSQFVAFTTDNGGECTGASCEFEMNAEHTANAEYNLETFELTLNESGPGALNAECGGGSCGSLTEIPYGTSVTVTAESNLGAETTVFEGTGSAAGCEAEGSPCTFTMEGASSVSASFEYEEEMLTIVKPGTGTGAVECNGGSCAGPWFYGETIEVTATPTGGSTLGALSGTGSASACGTSPCSFEITEPSTVSVSFDPPNSATLFVFKGGNGNGTVKSLSPNGAINCGATCNAAYEEGETVELEAEAPSGSVFAGWLGCHPVAGEEEKCRVKLSEEEVDVTAVFLTEGVQGEAGETPTLTEFEGSGEPVGEPCGGRGGVAIETAAETKYVCNGTIGHDGEPGETPTITVTPFGAGEHGCPAGGNDIDVEIEGNHTHAYVCNGEEGQDGERGEIGFPGPEGPAGSTGPQGSQGPAGANGAQGPQGAQGAQGPQGKQGKRGKQGPAGKVKVTCKVKGSKKVKCTVKYPKSNKRSHKKALHWRLMRGGHAQSHGSTSVHRLNRVLGHLGPGRYVLHVNGQRTAVVIPAHQSRGGHRRG